MNEHRTPNNNAQTDVIIRVIRIAGFSIAAFGLLFFFNIGNAAAFIGIDDPMTLKFLGGAMIVTGIVDIIVVPRVLDAVRK